LQQLPEKESALERLKRLEDSQQKRLEELEEEEKEAKKSAEFIKSHYGDFEALHSSCKKEGLGQVEELAKSRGWKLNKKEKILEMEVP
jgi:hypothetical protein